MTEIRYVQRDDAGRIVGVYMNPQPGYAEEAIPLDQIPAPVSQKTIRSLDWIARFTPDEQTAIFTARRANAQLDIWITQLAAAGTVTLDDGTGIPDARLHAGVLGLVSAGLIPIQRAAAVLTP